MAFSRSTMEDASAGMRSYVYNALSSHFSPPQSFCSLATKSAASYKSNWLLLGKNSLQLLTPTASILLPTLTSFNNHSAFGHNAIGLSAVANSTDLIAFFL